MVALGNAIAAFTLVFLALFYSDPPTSPEAAAWWATQPDIEERVEQWDRLAWCESRTRNIASSSGNYRGFFQFHRRSWEAVGGTGDPMDWSWNEQLYRSERLYSLQSHMAWPGYHRAGLASLWKMEKLNFTELAG